MLDYQSLFTQAAQLPLADRVQLIEDLWDTVPEEALPPVSDEWLAEIQRRSAEIDAGRVTLIPWEQIHAESLRRAGLDDAG